MAYPATHIPYANKVIKKFLSDRPLDLKKFYLGTLFPDIRYLGKISRETTHVQDPTVEGLLKIKNNDFMLGMYVHSLVDVERERTLSKMGAYEIVVYDRVVFNAMKFVEDTVTYELYDDWQKIIVFLDDVLEEETKITSKDSVLLWHKILQKYYRQKPDISTFGKFATAVAIDPQFVQAAGAKIKEIQTNSELVDIIKKTYQNIFEDGV